MKRIFSLSLIFVLVFGISGCKTDKTMQEGETEIAIEDASEGINTVPPILGIEIESGEIVSFVALSKSGTYSWSYEKSGKTEHIQADGLFCLDVEGLASVDYKDTDGKGELKFTGSVKSYKIYKAKVSQLDGDTLDILDEKNLSDDIGKVIEFSDDSDYYYVISVQYAQGSMDYGFILKK